MLFPTNSETLGRGGQPHLSGKKHPPSAHRYYTPLFAVCQQRIFPKFCSPPFSTLGGNGMGGLFRIHTAEVFGDVGNAAPWSRRRRRHTMRAWQRSRPHAHWRKMCAFVLYSRRQLYKTSLFYKFFRLWRKILPQKNFFTWRQRKNGHFDNEGRNTEVFPRCCQLYKIPVLYQLARAHLRHSLCPRLCKKHPPEARSPRLGRGG